MASALIPSRICQIGLRLSLLHLLFGTFLHALQLIPPQTLEGAGPLVQRPNGLRVDSIKDMSDRIEIEPSSSSLRHVPSRAAIDSATDARRCWSTRATAEWPPR